VSQDVYGNTGDKLLIPKGSTLIGQYSSGIAMGQQRVFVMWTRLIRPDGVSMMLGSPGTDRLGTAGLGADVLQTHFWERFGGATLVSIVGGLVATAGVSEDAGYNSASDYRMMMADNFQQSANATLLSTVSRKPTIIVYQGSKINVFVNRDLSFHDVEVNHAG
jgi:type IV secretion system protein VirB10